MWIVWDWFCAGFTYTLATFAAVCGVALALAPAMFLQVLLVAKGKED